jgi:hypothetical protein
MRRRLRPSSTSTSDPQPAPVGRTRLLAGAAGGGRQSRPGRLDAVETGPESLWTAAGSLPWRGPGAPGAGHEAEVANDDWEVRAGPTRRGAAGHDRRRLYL